MRNDDILDPNKYNYWTFVTTIAPSYLPNLDFNKYSLNILPCTKINNNLSNSLISHPSINVTTVPPNYGGKNL